VKQQDFWPHLSPISMGAVSRPAGSRAPHRSGSEERGTAPARRVAPPTGNTGNENKVRGGGQ
jgi:hypothetical protein